MTKQLVLIGGGHAHMVTLAKLHTFIDKGYGVTVIQPSEHHYYSGMGPGMLGGTYNPDDIRFATRTLVEKQGGTFILGSAYRIDPHTQRVILAETKEEIPYDVLSCNAGSYVPKDMIKGEAKDIFTAKPIEELLLARQRILQLSKDKQITIAVIGSGPSAIEIAGNIHQLCRQQAGSRAGSMPKIQLFCGRNFMAGRPARVRRLTRAILERKGVEIIKAGHVQQIANGRLQLENGQSYFADIIFPATGVKPSKIFARSGLPIGSDGGLLVDDCLRSYRYANIFGGGDCITFKPEPLDRVGVYAVRQNPVLYRNLLGCLEEKEPEKFVPGGSYLLIYNLGDGEGVFSKWSLTFAGKLAFRIKDRIDRRFIKTFQQD